MEFGVLAVPEPRRSARTARLLEELGFDTVLFPDSQNLAPEVWGQLMLAAQATTRVHLGPGVTNSVTRDPAVTASAALALQAESGGRAVLGIGRGDSSVQRIGKREDRVAIPVEVAATGPRVIEVAARHADAICLAVGADPAHLGAVLAHARAAARAAGRDPRAVRYGAFVTAVLHDDVRVARDAVRGAAASFARFSAFAGSDLARLPAPLAAAARYLREHYDMRNHTRTGVPHTAGIGDEFVDWFAIAGPPEVARERFGRLAALGLDFCHVIPGSTGMPREVAVGSLQRLAGEVMPALRG